MLRSKIKRLKNLLKKYTIFLSYTHNDSRAKQLSGKEQAPKMTVYLFLGSSLCAGNIFLPVAPNASSPIVNGCQSLEKETIFN